MDKNIEFLNYIYQNAEMGVIGIDHIIDRVSNADLERLIREQREEYNQILSDTKDIFKKYGKEEKEIGTLAKMGANMTTDMMMLMKKGEDKAIAKMMIEGSNKGIIEITEKLNNYTECDQEIIDLANKLLETEQHNLDELKKYL